jgi:endoglucanase
MNEYNLLGCSRQAGMNGGTRLSVGCREPKAERSQACLNREVLAAIASFLALLVVPAASASSHVRVNQLGYEVGTPSRAYLLAAGSEKGTFNIRDSEGMIVYSAPIGANLGTWGSFTVYALDFKVSKTGDYTIEVSGTLAATSPRFDIAPPARLYSGALANALYFFQNERDGAEFISTALRTAPGHLNDRSAKVYVTPKFDANDNIIGDLKPTGAVIDAEGGWWDAGDYLKFVETTSYTVALLLIGVRDFPKEMGAGSSTSDFTGEARFGLDWLQKMWDDESKTLYYQVGIGTGNNNITSDHDIWRLPQDDDSWGGSDPSTRYIRHRPVFVAGPPGSKISPNLAGRLAADFAECSQLFRQSDPEYANRCLHSAEHVFDLANTAPSGHLLTVAPFDFYPETEWRDDMELGATELYFAVRHADFVPLHSANFYLEAASHWAHAYIVGPNDAADTLNLYDVSGLAHFELYRALAAAQDRDDLEVSQSDLLKDLGKQLGNALAQGKTDPFGFGFPWNVSDTATHGAGLSITAKEYSVLTHSGASDRESRRWMANILGANAWGASFIVRDGTIFPDCMQHQVANIVGSLHGASPVLRGALVEGPNSSGSTGRVDGMRTCPPANGDRFAPFNGNGAVFVDNVESFATVEPAIDLAAPSLLMFAWRIAGIPSDTKSEVAIRCPSSLGAHALARFVRGYE